MKIPSVELVSKTVSSRMLISFDNVISIAASLKTVMIISELNFTVNTGIPVNKRIAKSRIFGDQPPRYGFRLTIWPSLAGQQIFDGFQNAHNMVFHQKSEITVGRILIFQYACKRQDILLSFLYVFQHFLSAETPCHG